MIVTGVGDWGVLVDVADATSPVDRWLTLVSLAVAILVGIAALAGTMLRPMMKAIGQLLRDHETLAELAGEITTIRTDLAANTVTTTAVARSLDVHTTELTLHLKEADRRDDLIAGQARQIAVLGAELVKANTAIAVLESHKEST